MVAALCILLFALLAFFLIFRFQRGEGSGSEQSFDAGTARTRQSPALRNEAAVPAAHRAVVQAVPPTRKAAAPRVQRAPAAASTPRSKKTPVARAAGANASSAKPSVAKMQKHLALLPEIEAQYRAASKEKDPFSAEMEACIVLCQKDISLAASCLETWRNESPGSIPRYPTFGRLAIIHEKRGEYQKAIKVCEKAIQLGFLEDGTKGGMQSRLSRLQTKKARAAGR